MLRALRNLVADRAAMLAARYPSVEPMFCAMGRAADPIPVIRTIFRRWTDTLVDILRKEGRQFRRVQIENVSFLFDCSDFTTRGHIFAKRLFEPDTTRFLLSTLAPGQIVLDVGANRGYISMIIAHQVGPSGRVFSFEPNPPVRAELLTHIELNGFRDRIFVAAEALSDTDDETVNLYVSRDALNSGLSSLTPSKELLRSGSLSPSTAVAVTTRTLDRFCEVMSLLQPIDLIKVDVEGAELMVVRGAERILRERPPRQWIIETERDSAAWTFLVERGYRVAVLDPAGDKVNAVFTHLSVRP